MRIGCGGTAGLPLLLQPSPACTFYLKLKDASVPGQYFYQDIRPISAVKGSGD